MQMVALEGGLPKLQEFPNPDLATLNHNLAKEPH